MRIVEWTVEKAKVSCNCCNRGVDTPNGKVFPYKIVYEIQGNASTFKLCPECLMKVKSY